MTTTRRDFARAVKAGLGIRNDLYHVGVTRALVAWMGAESGWYAPCDGLLGAASNPLNSSLALPLCTAATPYNHIPIQNYLTIACGIKATVATFQESRYDDLVAVMEGRFVMAKTVLYAVARSEWGTFKHADGSPNYDYADAILTTYLADRTIFNAQEITGQ